MSINQLVLSTKRFASDWLPRRCFTRLHSMLHNYRDWKNISQVVQNWRCCWLANHDVYSNHQREGFITAKYCNGLKLHCWPHNLGVIVQSQEYFDFPISFKPGDAVIDIGAHVGAVSLPLAFRGMAVYAYEPDLHNFKLLKLNKESNKLDSLHISPCAVSETAGKKVFTLGHSSTTGSLSNAQFCFASADSKTREVQTTTLAKIFENHSIPKVKLLKIDCEGSEYNILFSNDSKEILQKCHFLIAEVHPVTSGYDKYQLYTYLTGLGFLINVVESLNSSLAVFYCKNMSYVDG